MTVRLRRGLPREPGGEDWPPAPASPFAAAAEAVDAATASVETADAVAVSSADVAVSASTSDDAALEGASATSAGHDSVARGTSDAGVELQEAPVRRGLPRESGGEPWPAAATALVAVRAGEGPGTVADPAPEPDTTPVAGPFTDDSTAEAAASPASAPESKAPKRAPSKAVRWAAVLASALALVLVIVAASRWLLSLDGVASFVERYPGTTPSAQRAGIEVRMITGDHAVTAGAIGAELGLGPGAISGADLRTLDDAKLNSRLGHLHVFGRVTPQDKLRLVGMLQSQGEVVAMTGDAVNDAAAIKQADIGVAMGSGSEVTKQAAKLVLTDDNFSTLVHAVELGRVVYDKIISYLRFQMSQLFSMIFLFLAASAFAINDGIAMFPGMVLFLNFFITLFAVLAIAGDPTPPGIMDRPPRDPAKGVTNPASISEWLLYGVTIFIVSLVPLVWGPDAPSPTAPSASMTMVYIVVGFATVLSALLMRRAPESGLLPPISSAAKMLVWPVLLLVATTEFGFLQNALGTVSLTGWQWLECIALLLPVLAVVEAHKWWLRRRAQAAKAPKPTREPVVTD